MALGKIDHIDIFVDDLEKAEEYFIKKLEFKLLRRFEHGRQAGKSIELQSAAGDFFFDLHQGSEEQYKRVREEAPGFPHIHHIAFKVDDINKEVEELRSKGVSFRQDAPLFNPITGRTFANAPDADGRYWIQLSEAKKVA